MRLLRPLPGVVILAAVLSFSVLGCMDQADIPLEGMKKAVSGTGPERFSVYASYKDIPGVTPEETAAIERFRREGRTFSYGMIFSSECFEGENGKGGYAALFCEWLSRLFGIPFSPEIYTWNDLTDGLVNRKIDFTGELSTGLSSPDTYYMTSAIAERFVTIVQKSGSPDLAVMAALKPPRIGFLQGSSTYARVVSNVGFDFAPLYFETVQDACRAILLGRLDAFLDEAQDGITDRYSDLFEEAFLPYIYSSVSMATGNPELEPVISIVQKYLDRGALYQLTRLYNQGNRDFQHHRFFMSLSDEERAYMERHRVIQFREEQDNYPVAFYNTAESQWQGIAWDILREIETISGLRFEAASDPGTFWADSLEALEEGREIMVSELLKNPDRAGRFLWSETYLRDNYALLSRVEHEEVGINELLYSSVGLIKASAYAEVFKQWFPHHPYITEYNSITEALAGLKDGQVDLVMGTKNMLLTFTNYWEEPGFKVVKIFHLSADSAFGFNREARLLRSVINKALALIDTDVIVSRWTSKVFDYRLQMIRFRQPYLIGCSILLGLGVFLLIALVQKYKESGQQLEAIVRGRTMQLEEQSRELEIQKNAAQTALKVKNRFLANMSHEIRTPLNAIIGLAQTETEKARDDSRENLGSIHRSGMALLSVINDLLDISNIESGEMKLKTAAYSLPGLINSAATAARLWIGEKPVQFLLELDENLPLKLCGDKQRVKQILNKLLNNAVKYTSQGSVILRIGCEKIPESAEDLFLVFEIRDTGMGIREEHIGRLFTDYGQADTGSSRSTGGIGMGLLISKKLAELMDGDVSAASEYGRGSVFTARIRQTVAEAGIFGKETAEKLKIFSWKEDQGERPCLPYARILVVDDVPTNHAVARGILKPYRVAVDSAFSGQEAVDIIARAEIRYDAVFMDHMMPEMDGMEAVKMIRSLGTTYASSIPVIALTANALPGNEELFLQNGFNAFLAKPININLLNKVLFDWVRNAEKEQLLALQFQDEDSEPECNLLSRCSIDGVDLAAGAAQFGGEETYLEIVKVFVNDTPRLLKDIQQSLDGFRIMPAAAAAALSSLKNYTIAVHGLKGSCYGICAASLGNLARELEMAAKAEDINKVLELNSRFIEEAERLVKELQVLFPSKGEKPKLQKDAPDRALLMKLFEAVRTYNINDIFAVLKDLEAYSYKTHNSVIEGLRLAADNYEYADLISLLTGVLEKKDGHQEPLSETAG